MTLDEASTTDATALPTAEPGQKTMQAVVKKRPGQGAELVIMPVPAPGPEDVLVKVRATSVCGTDLHIYNWDPWAERNVDPPLIVGHEMAGEVVALGERVQGLGVGDLVAAETHLNCGRCYQCLTGRAHLCQNTAILGVHIDGCFADYVRLPARLAWKLPPGMPPEIGAIHEPLGNAVHATLAGEVAGRSVVVFGCGPIGLCSIGVALAAGAAQVFAVDLQPYRLELATRLGATRCLNPRETDVVEALLAETGGRGVDVVVEMSGSPVALQQGLRALTNGGRVSLLGIPSRPVELDLARDVIFKGATLQGITGRRMFDTWYTVSALVSSGRLNVRPVITHYFPLREFAEAMAVTASGNSGKVVLIPD